jgi:hypothetical protein
MVKYKVVFDDGKPYERTFSSESALKKAIKDFYLKHKDSDDYYDSHVYNSKGDDITESQFITEMVGQIMEDAE